MAPEPFVLFGGIFNPVHNGHLAVASLARDALSVDKIHFYPSGSPPHKATTDVADGCHRLAMLKLACADHPEFVVHSDELDRGGTTYTIDTLLALSRIHSSRKYCFIIGSDNLREVATWKRYREVLKLVTLCVAHRPGHALKVPTELSSAEIIPLPSPEWGISSTMLRTYIARGYRCTGLVPDSVADYIARNKLYA